MIVDVFATERHFADHLLPLWDALDVHERGTWWTGGASEPLARYISDRAAFGGMHATDPPDGARLTVVASHTDYRYTPRNRPVVYLEHGAGQTYQGVTHGGYSGGEGRERIVLFLCPNERAARLNRERYPGVPAVAVGSPKLDRCPAAPKNERPVVAFSAHWDCQIAPETRTGFWEYAPALPALQEHYTVLGHGHPRAQEMFRGTYDTLGIEVVDDFAEIIERADCYVCDNSSTMYEWCALDRPIVSLQPSFYRTDVHHGLRFWNAAPRPVCNTAADLPRIVGIALQDRPRHQLWRQHCVRAAYDDLVDGNATARAVEAIRSLAC